MSETLFIPIILGTARQGRQSEHVAGFVLSEMRKRPEIETEIIDIRYLKMRLDDAGEEMKDPAFAEKMTRADGVVIVTPEYNHGYPGLLKHALDMCLDEYNHKAVGICGVSFGPWGGARVIENLVPILRELGFVLNAIDVNFAHVGESFDEQGNLKDQKYVGRVARFLNELVWMSRVMRHGREKIPPL
ncbi:MAG: NAD(P)H-dependent oxidoreductase [Verrucomicrobiota bacterium]|nr:NAD(P)H-dependent oxidoreductase [Verrucomicrobiota bacterium]